MRLLAMITVLWGLLSGPLIACSIALVLAIDVSSSIDDGEYTFQHAGLADALTDPEIADVLVHHQVALTVVQWSGAGEASVVLPWKRMVTYHAVSDFAQAVRDVPRAWDSSNTAVGDAIRFSAAQFEAVPDCRRHVIDVSGDGGSNAGIHTGNESRAAAAAGIEINGIAIDTMGLGITTFYEKFVMTKGGFVITSRGFRDYPRSIREKLFRELVKPLS